MYGTQTADEHLVAAVRAGDDRAFEQLYQRYRRRIAAYIYGMVKDYGRSEEIAQDVFVSALRRMRNTDCDIAFKPWIYEIAKNACIDQFRRGRRAELVSYDAEDGLGESDRGRLVNTDPEPDAAVDQKLSLDHLRGAFGGLSEAHHDILIMRELEGMSYRQIGDRLGMSRASVESTLFRARKRLSEEYDELVSGERCLRVQSIITASAGQSLGIRDQRRLARHVSYCQPCRRHAAIAGVDVAELLARPALSTKIAAVLPLPAFLRERWDLPGRGEVLASSNASTIANWSAQMAPAMDPGGMATWAKAIVAAATVAIAGVGANTAKEKLTTDPAPESNPPAVVAPGGPLDRGTAPGDVRITRETGGTGAPAAADRTSSPVLAPPASSDEPGLPTSGGREGRTRLPGVLPRTDGPGTGGGPGKGHAGEPGSRPGDLPQTVAPPPTTFGDTTKSFLSPPAPGSGPPNAGSAVQETASGVLTPFMPSAPSAERQSGEPAPQPAWQLPLPIPPAPQARAGDPQSSPGMSGNTARVVGSLVAP